MLTADQIWKRVKHHLPATKRQRGQVVFRRAVREFLSYRCERVYLPHTKRLSKSVQVGERWVFTGGRWRRRKTLLGAKGVGRPSGVAVDYLVARLGYLWASSHQTATTIHHRRYQEQSPTRWEEFLCDVLIKLGVHDCRRHAVAHSKGKPKRLVSTNLCTPGTGPT
jgi:hypothetical protein